MNLPTDERPAVLMLGGSLACLKRLPDACVHCCVTSPPYWALRDYGVRGQIGLESTPEKFIAKLVEVFEEVKRVLHPSGLLFVNMGDSYSSGNRDGHGTRVGNKQETNVGCLSTKDRRPRMPRGLKPKDLIGVPWMLAFALRNAGWYLRSEIVWVKRSPMPESTTDRPGKALEYVFMLSKSPGYFFDMEAVRKDHKRDWWNETVNDTDHVCEDRKDGGNRQGNGNPAGRNFRNADLWFQSIESPHGLCGIGDELIGLDVTSQGYAEAHFATFPMKLVEPFILAGTSAKGVCPTRLAPWKRTVERERKPTRPGTDSKINTAKPDGVWGVHSSGVVGNRDPQRHCTTTQTTGWQPTCKCPAHEPIPARVLDPFLGSGTTLAVAIQHGRHGIGIELNPAYLELAKKRLANPVGVGGLFGPTSIETTFQPELFT